MYKHKDRLEGLMHGTKMNWQTEEGAQKLDIQRVN